MSTVIEERPRLELLPAAVGALPPRQQLHQQGHLRDGNRLSAAEVGAAPQLQTPEVPSGHITRERIRQIEAKTLRKLRACQWRMGL